MFSKIEKYCEYFVLVGLLVLAYTFYSFNYYEKEEVITVKVLKQIYSIGHYGSTKPILVLQEIESGKIFDMYPSASFAYRMPEGSIQSIVTNRWRWNPSRIEDIFLTFGYIAFEMLALIAYPAALIVSKYFQDWFE